MKTIEVTLPAAFPYLVFIKFSGVQRKIISSLFSVRMFLHPLFFVIRILRKGSKIIMVLQDLVCSH